MSFVRAYLRASTKEQDASRARHALDAFVQERGLRIASYYVENESGASLERPELNRLLDDAQSGDVILVEQVDRLSRLKKGEWEQLRMRLKAKNLRVVALDLPTSWQFLAPATDATSWMMDAINSMMLDMLAAMARKDYEDRRRRQAEGIAKRQAEGKALGRPQNEAKRRAIEAALRDGQSWNQIADAVGVSRMTVARAAKRLKTL
ncbi:recombinase family protein [Nitratireductor aquimarinus]|uniref:recombinase family protein n=1 Tax=Nitratireductor aquimarinus TaxID=889300 RepID=UPI00293548FA|nr:recombinase family protein [Nitratireductor aquimarinus]MDV2966015.1 recombinase family protein [Nitratireductor aquimarinus]